MKQPLVRGTQSRLHKRALTCPAWSRLRLGLALERLRQGERDLTRLALELGYSHHSHFTMAFTRCYGEPPRTLRRNLTVASDA